MAVQQNFTNIKTISQLPVIETDNMAGWDLFEISHGESSTVNGTTVLKYNSRAVTVKNITTYFTHGLIEELKNNYNFPTTPGHEESFSSITLEPTFDFAAAKKVYDTFLFLESNETNNLTCPCRGLIDFKKNPIITDAEPWGNFGSTYNSYVMNLEKTKGLMDSSSPMFIDKNSRFSSELFNVENNLRDEETNPLGIEDEKHNRYIFRITNYRSDTWKATHSGIFTCWGWVDMHTDAQPGNNCEAWVALEGLINDKWSILQVQPFDKHNGETISYVGFTFPVHEGLVMRITTGFRVGSNSGKYQQKNGSLANHVANCFVGGIYYSPMVEQTKAADTSREVTLPKGFDFHEERLDESKKSTVAELKEKLNKVIDKLNEIAGTNISVDDL